MGADLDPLLTLLTLPMQPEASPCCTQPTWQRTIR